MIRRDVIYVQLYQSRFDILNVTTGQALVLGRDVNFSSPRMVLADFTGTQFLLRQGIRKVRSSFLSPNIVLHPMELIEGGITQVEHRALRELGHGIGGRRVAIWEGDVLPSASVKRVIAEFREANR